MTLNTRKSASADLSFDLSLQNQQTIDKYLSLKHRLELGAVLDALDRAGITQTLLSSKSLGFDRLANDTKVNVEFLTLLIKCLWINGFFTPESHWQRLTLSPLGLKKLLQRSQYTGMLSGIEAALCGDGDYTSSQSVNLDSVQGLPSWLFSKIYEKSEGSKIDDGQQVEASEECDNLFAPLFSHTATYFKSYQCIYDRLSNHIKPEDHLFGDDHLDRLQDINTSADVFDGVIAQAFFKQIKERFDYPFIWRQPSVLVDIGCGNGSMLKKTYEFIRDHTSRGSYLAVYPLTLIAVDISESALSVASNTLEAIDTPTHVVQGSIDHPKLLWKHLQGLGFSPKSALHMSKSVIHDRDNTCEGISVADLNNVNNSFSVSLDRYGHLQSVATLRHSLFEHLVSWRPFIAPFGYLVIEAHNGLGGGFKPSDISAKAQSLLTTLNLSHDLSSQFLVSQQTFLEALKLADLQLMQLINLQKVNSEPTLALYDLAV
jgi:SAM-dependent methyltransferase